MTNASTVLDQSQQKGLSQKVSQQELKNLVDESTPKYKRLKNLNQRIGIGLGVAGILLSLGATISGIYQAARVAAIFAALAATSQSMLFAYPVDRRSVFYRSIATKNMNLSTDLEIKSYTEEQLQEVLEKFKAIRLEAAAEEPQSSNLSESLDLRNIENYISQLKKVLEEYERLK